MPRLNQYTRRFTLVACAIGLVILGAVYVHSHPLVFNESFFGHAHCINGGGLALVMYAHAHGGRFPYPQTATARHCC